MENTFKNSSIFKKNKLFSKKFIKLITYYITLQNSYIISCIA